MILKKTLIIILISFSLFIGGAPLFQPVNAQTSTDYTMLAPLPYVGKTGSQTPEPVSTSVSYVEGIMKLIIALAGALAVMKLVYAGFIYMTIEAFQGKANAKEQISDALIGFIMIIGSFIILNTINPKFKEVDLTLQGVNTVNHGGTSYKPDPDEEEIDQRPILTENYPFAEGCTGCNIFSPEIPKKPLGQLCALVNPRNQTKVGACLVNKALNDKLVQFNRRLIDQHISWQVTEAYPPTVVHKSRCHNPGPIGGYCVDAAITSPSNPRDTLTIGKFLGALSDTGLEFIYEVRDQARKDELVRGGLNRYKDKIIVTRNSEHFHFGFLGGVIEEE